MVFRSGARLSGVGERGNEFTLSVGDSREQS